MSRTLILTINSRGLDSSPNNFPAAGIRKGSVRRSEHNEAVKERQRLGQNSELFILRKGYGADSYYLCIYLFIYYFLYLGWICFRVTVTSIVVVQSSMKTKSRFETNELNILCERYRALVSLPSCFPLTHLYSLRLINCILIPLFPPSPPPSFPPPSLRRRLPSKLKMEKTFICVSASV